jgi:hypothetical protein
MMRPSAREPGELEGRKSSAEACHDRPLYGRQNASQSPWICNMYSLVFFTVPRGTGAYGPRYPDHGMLCRGSWRWAAQEALINCEILTGEATEPYLVQAIARICESPRRIYGYCRSEFGRIGIGASADCRKRN